MNSLTRESTNTLRGLIAIIVVLNHFLNAYVVGDQAGFANAAVSGFFFLSGYGIFSSLKSIESKGMFNISGILLFLGKRLLRLMPLVMFASLGGLVFDSIGITLSNLLGTDGVFKYWFIASILQCYVIAPWLHRAIRQHPGRFVAVFAGGLAVLTGLYYLGALPLPVKSFLDSFGFVYRSVVGLHLLVFLSGMLFARHKSSNYSEMLLPRKWLWMSGILAVSLMVLLKSVAVYGVAATFAFSVIPIPFLILFIILFIQSRNHLSLLQLIGIASLPIYLFHQLVFRALEVLQRLLPPAWAMALFFAAILPLFFVGAYVLQKITDGINGWIVQALRKGTRGKVGAS